jgi:hypothetical protein
VYIWFVFSLLYQQGYPEVSGGCGKIPNSILRTLPSTLMKDNEIGWHMFCKEIFDDQFCLLTAVNIRLPGDCEFNAGIKEFGKFNGIAGLQCINHALGNVSRSSFTDVHGNGQDQGRQDQHFFETIDFQYSVYHVHVKIKSIFE